jgi:hypothetical protein
MLDRWVDVEFMRGENQASKRAAYIRANDAEQGCCDQAKRLTPRYDKARN